MSQPASYSIVCQFCEGDALQSLRTLVGMLRQYLACDWHVEEDASRPAALQLINLDRPEGVALMASLEPGVRAVGCSLQPRQHPPGTIHHRPFRSYELLSLLKEVERVGPASNAEAGATAGKPAQQALEGDNTRRFKLSHWPDEFQNWPREWWQILACLRVRRLTAAALVEELSLPPATVAECLDQLLRIDAVTVKFDIQAMSAPPPKRPWYALGARIASLLRGAA